MWRKANNIFTKKKIYCKTVSLHSKCILLYLLPSAQYFRELACQHSYPRPVFVAVSSRLIRNQDHTSSMVDITTCWERLHQEWFCILRNQRPPFCVCADNFSYMSITHYQFDILTTVSIGPYHRTNRNKLNENPELPALLGMYRGAFDSMRGVFLRLSSNNSKALALPTSQLPRAHKTSPLYQTICTDVVEKWK